MEDKKPKKSQEADIRGCDYLEVVILITFGYAAVFLSIWIICLVVGTIFQAISLEFLGEMFKSLSDFISTYAFLLGLLFLVFAGTLAGILDIGRCFIKKHRPPEISIKQGEFITHTIEDYFFKGALARSHRRVIYWILIGLLWINLGNTIIQTQFPHTQAMFKEVRDHTNIISIKAAAEYQMCALSQKDQKTIPQGKKTLVDVNTDLSDSLDHAIIYTDAYQYELGNKLYQKLHATLEKRHTQVDFISDNQKCPDNIISPQELKEWTKKVDKAIPTSWIGLALFELGL